MIRRLFFVNVSWSLNERIYIFKCTHDMRVYIKCVYPILFSKKKYNTSSVKNKKRFIVYIHFGQGMKRKRQRQRKRSEIVLYDLDSFFRFLFFENIVFFIAIFILPTFTHYFQMYYSSSLCTHILEDWFCSSLLRLYVNCVYSKYI